jgi:hypothetical protein
LILLVATVRCLLVWSPWSRSWHDPYSVIGASAADDPDSFGPVIAVSSPSPAPASGPGVTDWLTGIGTIALAFITVVTLIVTIWITITDRRNAEAARRRDRQQDSAQRLLGRIAGIVPYFLLIPGVFQSRSAPFGNLPYNPRALECLNAVRALEAGMYADMAGLGDTRAADQYRELVRRVLAAAPGVGEDMGERTSEALRLSALFVRESLENLIEHGQSLPGQVSSPSRADPSGRQVPERPGPAELHAEPGDRVEGPHGQHDQAADAEHVEPDARPQRGKHERPQDQVEEGAPEQA